MNPPTIDEIEISLFGPGYGESVLVHLGRGQWIVVDSCFATDSNDPAPLEYLRQIGLNPATSIKRVFITHWDDDHVGGLANIVEAAPNAQVVFSAAIFSEELWALLRAYSRETMGFDSGVREVNRIFEILRDRRQKPVLALENKIIWADQSDHERCCVIALSPPDSIVIDGHVHVGEMLAQARTQQRLRFVEPERNMRSVVLLLKSGERQVLLGADLEHVPDKDQGWTAILDSKLWPGQASLFKVPHHGSKTGQSDRVWTELLTPNPLALLTPWKRGGHVVPRRQELEWLLSHTPHLYVTAIPQRKRRKRTPEVEQMIRVASEHLSIELNLCGHIRARSLIADGTVPWKVDMFNSARQIDAKRCKAFPSH